MVHSASNHKNPEFLNVTFKRYTLFTFIPLFCYAVFLVSCETLNKCLNFEDVMIHQKARHTTAN